ncbi:hypothetical protein K1T71_009031 [Dendrolimus kikuchii]|uniref:Uncharacterized protein n=1 Tax=Dendrolimus kikuchii TaxID=765133 RepID=A0ACC1CX81_9NEOP|nr:hypothetical protein K1T71_009031 [Dendrolimus kikuchii]
MTMQENVMQQGLTNIDLTKIAAIQQKRTLAFVNHFVMTNVQFLNNFMRNCENKLMLFEQKLEKVNAAMILLESKLSSIPELNTAQTVVVTQKPEVVPQDVTEDKNQIEEEVQDIQQEIQNKESRPEYDRFVKMVQVGVPLQAVKIKVNLEGLDPNVLEEILGK